MTSIEKILQQEVNPFDPLTHKIFSFWDEQANETPVVSSVHQDIVTQVADALERVTQDQVTRSLVIYGDSGSGKSVLLKRLKDQFNQKAFFAYIGPWPDSDYVWRHTLRQVVDSLLQVPEGQSESQLLLWLKGLSAFSEKGFQKWILGERKLFIRDLQDAYPTGIYNSREFFGILYDLTDPGLRPLAYQWLKGDDLDEEELQELRVKNSINSEDAAQKILANFGKIAASTYPIVLCFDNLDNIPKLPSGSPDLPSLFSLNTILHSQQVKNFLIIISLVTNDLKQTVKFIQQADKASLYKTLNLKSITLDQAEQLWAARLAPFHQQANPKPQSPIAPLHRQQLEKAFPGGKANPRAIMQLGYQLLIPPPPPPPGTPPNPNPPPINLAAAFKLLWMKEFKETEQKVSRLQFFSSLELAAMLRQVLSALEVKGIQPKVLPSPSYASYSFSYEQAKQSGKIGVVWTEESNMTSFFYVMRACEKLLKLRLCETLYFIRAAKLGKPKTKGETLFKQIFQTSSSNRHIIPDLASVHCLATYHKLINSACSGELVIANQVLNLEQLEALVRETKVLNDCKLLQDLELVNVKKTSAPSNSFLQEVKDYILIFVTQHQIVAQKTITKHTQHQFSQVTDDQVLQATQKLCEEGKLRVLDDKPPVPDQIICLVPQNA